MTIEIDKRFTVDAPPDRVWAYLTDPHRVSGCLPGSRITGQDGSTYSGTMKVRLGPVSSTYEGTVRFERLDERTHTAELSAEGRDTRGKGAADMTMTSVLTEIDQGTVVEVRTTVTVTGVLAQLGRGMVEDVSDLLFQQFRECMKETLEAEVGDPAGLVADPVGPASPRTGRDAPPARETPPSGPGSGHAGDDALDLGAAGTRAAARAGLRLIRSPLVWVIAAVLVGLVWMLAR